MDAHQRLVADVDARGRATRLLRQDGNGRIYYTFTRWQVPIATDSGGGATAPRAGGKEMLANKRQSNPPKKHSNLPL